MKMELIQPFINAADAVLSDALATPINVSDITMDEETYRRRATAAMVLITGEIEGRIIFDVEDSAAMKVASVLSGVEMEHDPQLVREAVCELANMVIGNAVTSLNDQGFSFRVHPPVVHDDTTGFRGTEEIEALVMDFSSSVGSVVINVAIQYNRRRHADRVAQ
jgi:chemotaxis protein CheX